MYCSACGHQIPEGARFCAQCGAPVGPAAPPPASPAPPPPYPGHPRGQNRTALWIGIAVAAVIVIAAAVAVPLLLLRGEEETVTDTTRIVSTTTTAAKPTTTRSSLVSSTTTSSSTSTSTTLAPSGPPGDSPGQWVEIQVPGLKDPVSEAAVSDEAVLVHTQFGDVAELHAYLFDTGTIVKLPVQAPDIWSVDLEGRLAVWYEGHFDANTGEPYDMGVFAFALPNGPLMKVAGGEQQHPYYPQVAGSWITWTEGEPWQESPDEYWEQRIYGVEIDAQGRPLGEPVVLVSSALAYVMGEGLWFYSLSSSHLAWEDAADHDNVQTGTYLMELDGGGLRNLGAEVWRPSLAEGVIAYWNEGVRYAYLDDLKPVLLDPEGDFPAAAPTYAAYYRFADSEEHPYEVVARGYKEGYEQVLAYSSVAPHFAPPLSASARHIAVATDETLRLFEWQGEGPR